MGKNENSCCNFFVKEFPSHNGKLDAGECVSRPHFVGNCILVYGQRSTRFPYQVLVGPDWSCMLCSMALIAVPTVFFIINVGLKVGVWAVIVAAFLGVSTLTFFVFTACSDPGIIFAYPDHSSSGKFSADESFFRNSASSGEREGEGEGDVECMPVVPELTGVECGLCGINRPRSAIHCQDCGVCIDMLDHHCPWTGKCIGKKNIHSFHSFLMSLLFLVIFVGVISLYALIQNYQIFTLP